MLSHSYGSFFCEVCGVPISKASAKTCRQCYYEAIGESKDERYIEHTKRLAEKKKETAQRKKRASIERIIRLERERIEKLEKRKERAKETYEHAVKHADETIQRHLQHIEEAKDALKLLEEGADPKTIYILPHHEQQAQTLAAKWATEGFRAQYVENQLSAGRTPRIQMHA